MNAFHITYKYVRAPETRTAHIHAKSRSEAIETLTAGSYRAIKVIGCWKGEDYVHYGKITR